MSSSAYLTAVTRRHGSDDYLSFPDYPHAHDLTKVSDVAALSIDLLRQVPGKVQDSLWLLQESTSLVYAFYVRLQHLQKGKFERLSILP